MTLALLLTAVGGAWAQTPGVKPLTIPNEWNGNQSENLYINHLPKDFVATTEERAEALSCPHPDPDVETVILIYGFDESDFMSVVEFRYGEYYEDYGIQYTLGDMFNTSQNGIKWYYTTEPGIDVTTNAASEQDLFTEAKFNMPSFDVDVNYMLVRDMQDETNPVTFSGLPTNDEPIIVKKGDDGKYQPAEALTIQLIDPVAAAEAQNIIGAEGITVKVLVGNGGTPIEYDQENPITLEAFLADMKPGYYWIKAEPTDENSLYDGTVYSSEFTAVEQYDLTVKPADEYSKGKLDNVTVGSESVTIDATTGKVTKTGITPDTEVKLKAKRGYVIEKVEAKKTVIPMLNAATTENIGMVVCNKGHLHDAKEAVPDGCTAVGILGKVTGTGHGLILALKNATNQNWNTINGWTSASYAGTTLKLLPDGARGTNLTSYTTLGETAVSNWAVGQKSDYEAIFANLGSTKADYAGRTFDGNVNAYITTGVGGTAISGDYWSATSANENQAWRFGSDYWSRGNKPNGRTVRPVLGF